MEEKVVYRTGIESTIDSASGRLTPRILERLKAEAGYDPAVKRDRYPMRTLDQMVHVLAAELFPAKSPEEAVFELGFLAIGRYHDSLLGKALFPAIRLLGPMRFLKRLPLLFRAVNNYAEVKVDVEGKTVFVMEHNEVGTAPHYFRELMQAAVSVVGLNEPRCELLSYDGHMGRYRVSWRA